MTDDKRASAMHRLLTCHLHWTKDGKGIKNSEWTDTSVFFDVAFYEFAAVTEVLLNASVSGLGRNYLQRNLFFYDSEIGNNYIRRTKPLPG